MDSLPSKKKVLIIGKKNYPHILEVSGWINMLGHQFVILDPLSSEDTLQIFLEPNNNEEPKNYGIIQSSTQGLHNFSEFSSVWMRFKCYSPMEWEKPIEKLKFDFIASEWLDTLKSLEIYMPHCRWLNPINPLVHQKPWQLFLAKQIGFKVPKTAISNDSGNVLKYFKDNSSIVFKTINICSTTSDDMTFTNLCDRKEIEENNRSIKLCPGIFQDFHKKSYELRVTAVGDQMLVCKVVIIYKPSNKKIRREV